MKIDTAGLSVPPLTTAFLALKPYFITFRDVEQKTYPTYPGSVKAGVHITGMVVVTSSAADRRTASQMFTALQVAPEKLERHHQVFIFWQEGPNPGSKDRAIVNGCLGPTTS